MSVHTKFDHPENTGCLATAPAVLRFASLFPRALRRREMHDRRAGGDLSHIRHDLSARNCRVIGDDDWIDVLKAEIEAAKRDNHINEIAAREAKGRRKEADELRRRGPVDPWKFTQEGPLREGILTVNKHWFGGTGPQEWDPDRVAQFVDRGVEFLQSYFPDGQLRELTVHVDEEAVHLHFLVAVWAGKVSQNRGAQRLLQPSANPLLDNYEHAQDLVGQVFLDMGIHRGERRAAAARAAKAAGLEGPSPREHVPPSKWRREQRRKALQDAAAVKAKAQNTVEGMLADAAMVSKSTIKKSRKHAIAEAKERRAEADQRLVEARIARSSGRMAGAFRRSWNAKLAQRAEALNQKMVTGQAQLRDMQERSQELARANAQAERELTTARRNAEAVTARVSEVAGGLDNLKDQIVTRTLQGLADDMAQEFSEPLRSAGPEIAPVVAAAQTYIGAIEAMRNDAAVLAQATLAERIAAKEQIAQQRFELKTAQNTHARREADLRIKWHIADRLLQRLEPLLLRITSWLRHAGLSSDMVDEGNQILHDVREVILETKSEEFIPDQ